MSIEYKKATLLDIKQMQQLVLPEIISGVILHRSDDEVASNIRSYTLAKAGKKIVGFVALHIHSPSLAEVRSLIVDKEYRGQKIGQQLVEHTIEEAKSLGVKELFTLTYQNEFFFEAKF